MKYLLLLIVLAMTGCEALRVELGRPIGRKVAPATIHVQDGLFLEVECMAGHVYGIERGSHGSTSYFPLFDDDGKPMKCVGEQHGKE